MKFKASIDIIRCDVTSSSMKAIGCQKSMVNEAIKKINAKQKKMSFVRSDEI